MMDMTFKDAAQDGEQVPRRDAVDEQLIDRLAARAREGGLQLATAMAAPGRTAASPATVTARKRF